ncbi:hypothetical protein [Polaribacter sp.]|uniref:hypothetical protein n=1 Tax=Polaribacter sp. TaxID=1920175 RepID=UPI003F6ABE73
MVKIILEDWQVKNLREYFGHNDKTQTAHWAYEVFNKAYKEQCTIPIVVKSLPQDNYCQVCKLPTDGEKCYSKRCPV